MLALDWPSIQQVGDVCVSPASWIPMSLGLNREGCIALLGALGAPATASVCAVCDAFTWLSMSPPSGMSEWVRFLVFEQRAQRQQAPLIVVLHRHVVRNKITNKQRLRSSVMCSEDVCHGLHL